MNKLVFIRTGGTIDKDYPHQKGGWAFEIGAPACSRVLEQLNPSFDYAVVDLLQKDSLKLNDNDRTLIIEEIAKHGTAGVIVTHGTDTLMDTAAFIAKHHLPNTIVLTGAMRPELFRNTDAHINIGMSIATAHLQPPGVYICMHGIVGLWSNVRRNAKGIFLLQ